MANAKMTRCHITTAALFLWIGGAISESLPEARHLHC
jgi:hypothetical protein